MAAFEIIFAVLGAIVGWLIGHTAADAFAGALVGFGFGIVFVWFATYVILLVARRIVREANENPVLREARKRRP